MEALFYLFIAALLVAALLATIAIWAPRRALLRGAAVVLLAAFVPLSYLVYTEVLSKPKPISHEWWRRHVESATLLGTSLDEGRAIYVWLRLEGVSEPRYYVLPWRQALAERLQQATDDAIASNGRIEIRDPFAKRAEEELGDINLEIRRPPRLPQKPLPPPARIFDPRGDAV